MNLIIYQTDNITKERKESKKLLNTVMIVHPQWDTV